MKRLLLLSLLLAGCGQGDKPAPTIGATIDQTKYVVAVEPAGARGVVDLRKEAKDGEEVVVVGRIGGSKAPFTGRAAFTITDTALKTCTEIGDLCKTPWDYCCETQETRAHSTVMVRFVDEQGKTLPADAKSGLGLKEMDTVVIKGKIVKTPDGELSLVASQLFVRPKQ